ncbi:winged helix DNA-binding domain-containing protein [Diplocloster modestus]|uniref:Winged helix DNA-binding domain-containing protein n=1 Tax=Diplocloster modestus TaxID=2850322 RepID=A0ABS6KBG2_9FIRM|nr:winged helix DNA-binding domain-containing protein [Diplocloster modestus]MBU9727864.1 winged helix DNA-binding domain-containing protein [Diplocloster modestus]
MNSVSLEQIRQFRLHTHHLDTWYPKKDILKAAGACGLQNSPPGAWENALYNRVAGCSLEDLRQMLEVEKTLLQAWSFRGTPVVFPASESDTFLSGLVSGQDEPWIYTQGIQLALDFLQMSFEEALALLKQVIPKLDGEVLKSKTALDQTLAEWVRPLLPEDKRELWDKPSMYGNPDKQTVGGAVVSFLLRPCAFMGLVVFGKREGISPSFTSYKHWTGHSIGGNGDPGYKLVRKYLHCFGPASPGGFADWLGCSPVQAGRIWKTVLEEIEPVSPSGRERFILSEDRELLFSPPEPERKIHLLGGHDPYLGLQDREVLLEDRARQKQIWQTVSNPGAVLWQGKIAGMWKSRKKGKGLDIEVTLWETSDGYDKNIENKKDIENLIDQYILFQQLKLNRITFITLG